MISKRSEVNVATMLEKLLAPRQSLGWHFCFTVLLRTRLHKSGEVRRDILLFFLYFSSGSTYLFNILVLDLHHRIDILSTWASPVQLQNGCDGLHPISRHVRIGSMAEGRPNQCTIGRADGH